MKSIRAKPTYENSKMVSKILYENGFLQSLRQKIKGFGRHTFCIVEFLRSLHANKHGNFDKPIYYEDTL